MRVLFGVVALSALAAAAPAWANDSMAELATGGLAYVTTDAVAMRSEDLFISMKEVRVRYEFQNTSDHDVTSLVAFPMPDIKGDIDFTVAVPIEDPANFLGFATTVDGAPVEAEMQQRVSALGVDQTATLSALQVPLAPQLAATRAALDALPQSEWGRLVDQGLAGIDEYDAGKGWERHLAPIWTLSTVYYWEQTFPAGKTVIVEHHYTPSVGATAGVSFDYEGARNEDWFKEYQTRYCIDGSFLDAFERAKSKPGGDRLMEHRIAYILTTAANWSGAISKFRLVIDKGAPGNLVSFCGEGAKKISATQFEVDAQDFYPQKDLAILILAPAEE